MMGIVKNEDEEKKFSIVFTFILAAGVLGGCGNSAKTQELSENIYEYEKIAEVALNDFQDTGWITKLMIVITYHSFK